MVEYKNSGKNAMLDGIRFTRDEKTHYYLSTTKIKNSRKRLHVYVWESNNNVVPSGFVVHHIDHDKSNNNLDNLKIICKKEHGVYHTSKLTKEQKEKRLESFLINALPKAAAWHSTEKGKKWHGEHSKQIWANKKEVPHKCDCCNSVFMSKRLKNKRSVFCSNACKSAERRKSGVDNETKCCVLCNGKFETNKYASRKYCSELCRSKKGNT